MTTPRTLRLSDKDNVVVAIDQITAGAIAAGIVARERVPRGHKMATVAIAHGEPVCKFGQIIGFATKPIAPGEWVHEHNCGMHDFARDYRFAEGARNDEILPLEQRATFEGYRRANGKVGTRNYIGILTSVNCSASVARFIAEAFNRSGILDDYPNIDGVVPFVHGTGCGMAGQGEGFELLQRTQWGYATHPNLGGALMVGLGCEVFQIAGLKDDYGLVERRSLPHHDHPGDRRHAQDASSDGVDRDQGDAADRRARRSARRVPASEIMLALQCGGSDGYSGITANPALGCAADHAGRAGRHRRPLARRRKSTAPSIC